IQDICLTAGDVIGTGDVIVVDACALVSSDTVVHIAPNGLATVTANFADNFTGGSYGSDGAGNTVYKLVLTGTDVASGLYALDPKIGRASCRERGENSVLNESGDIKKGSVG